MGGFDLHMHSRCSSDGILDPFQILTVVNANDMDLFSITDHNSVDGCRQLIWSEDKHGFGETNFVPSVELSLYLDDDEVHVCAYGLDPFSAVIDEIIGEYQVNRVKQAYERTVKLTELGFIIDYNRVMEAAAGKTPSGVTFLNVLKENSENLDKLNDYVKGSKSRSPYTNFYFDYFFKGGKAFVSVKLLDFKNVVSKLKDVSILTLAHPGLYKPEVIDKALVEGIRGIEAYTSYHSREQVELYLKIAEEKDLIVTAGSDFHGDRIKPEIHIGEHGCSDAGVPVKFFNTIKYEKLKYYTF